MNNKMVELQVRSINEELRSEKLNVLENWAESERKFEAEIGHEPQLKMCDGCGKLVDEGQVIEVFNHATQEQFFFCSEKAFRNWASETDDEEEDEEESEEVEEIEE